MKNFFFTGDRGLFDRVKQVLYKLVTFFYTTPINLNIFPLRTFGNNINRMNAIHLGKLTTRLYIVLLLISFAILSQYTVNQPQVMTRAFVKPSLDIFNDLLIDHSDTLQCPWSSISSI